MNFFLGLLAYLLIGLVLILGIARLVQGKPWLLVGSFAAYLAALVLIGCLPRKAH